MEIVSARSSYVNADNLAPHQRAYLIPLDCGLVLNDNGATVDVLARWLERFLCLAVAAGCMRCAFDF